jgi:hypothetical protein
MSIDFKKAFEKLQHSVIMSAAEKFDLPAHTLHWIGDFLRERFQRVALPTQLSPWVPVTSGVPQGSVLGPILFCLALNSLRACHNNTSIIKYADDVTFLHSIRKAEDDCLQSEWNNLARWSEANNLPINAKKCRVLDIITRKKMTLEPIECGDGSCLTQVSDMLLLGVTISSSMKWDMHIDNVLNKARKRFFVLVNLRKSGCSPSLNFRTYCSLLRSVLLYAYPVFCNAPLRLMEKLCRFERRCFRVIGSGDFPTLTQVGQAFALKLFREVEVTAQHPLRELFTERVGGRTRSRQCFLPLRSKTKRLSSSFMKFALM